MSRRTSMIGLITAALAIAATLSVAPPASATDTGPLADTAVARKCYGSAAPRCLELRFSSTPEFVRAYVWIDDASGGVNYDVAVNNVRIQEYSNKWTTRDWTINGDYDGWDFTSDVASSYSFDCREHWRYIRAQAYFTWRNHDTGVTDGEWLTSYPIHCSGY